ncbi:MAG: type II toxin-antitoxin system Phd/YefM family antitoxin [Pseudonocardiaceae bacterium]
MTAARAFELPPHSAAPAEAVDAAVEGSVVYLTHNGEPVAAVVPADVAAAIEALENAEDIRAARAARADPGPDIPLEDVLAEYADELAAYPDKR